MSVTRRNHTFSFVDQRELADVEESRRRVQELGSWANSHSWTHWVTLTFEVECSLEAAWRHFVGWARRAENIAQQRVSWFAVVAPGDVGGRTHIHALVHAGAAKSRKLQGIWALGRNEVERFDPTQRASWYMTSHLKHPRADYDISRHLRHSGAATQWLSMKRDAAPRIDSV